MFRTWFCRTAAALDDLILNLRDGPGRSNALVRRQVYKHDLTSLTPQAAIRLLDAFRRDSFLQRGACASLTLQADRVTGTEVLQLAKVAETMGSPVVEACLQMIIPKVIGRIHPADAAQLARITAALGIPATELVQYMKGLVKTGGPMRKRRITPQTMVDTLMAFSGWAKSGNIEKECFHLLGSEFGKVIDDLSLDEALTVLEAFAHIGNRHEVLLHHMWPYFALVVKNMTQEQTARMLRCMYCLRYYDTDFLYQFGAVLPILSKEWTDSRVVVNVLRAFADARVKLIPKIVHMLTCRTGSWSVDDLGEIAVFHPGICSNVLRNLAFSPDDDPSMSAAVALYVASTPTCAALSGGVGQCACSWDIEESWEDVEVEPSNVVMKPFRSYRQRDWRNRSEKRRELIDGDEEENALVPVTCTSSTNCSIPVDYSGIFKVCVEHFCQRQPEDWEELYSALHLQPEWISMVTTDFLPQEFEVKKIQKLKPDSLERQVSLTLERMLRRIKPTQLPAWGPIFVLS